ncbi:MAG: hypothetical protein V7765_20570 [Oleispira sp.]
MLATIFTKKITKNLYCSAMILSVGLLSACSDTDKETKKSTDYATAAIEANYSVEVLEGKKVSYVANFGHDGSSLELEAGDKVTVEIGAESLSLIESISSGTATYRLNRTETLLASKYFFEFLRETQEDADGSFVEVPESFSLTSPTSITGAFRPANGKTFPISWDQRTGGDDDGEEFTIRYDFDCRHDSGTPSISKSYVEKVEDTGEHLVNLLTVLAENGEVGNYQACSRFNIIAIRSSTDGNLDGALKSGSVVGSQVRTIEGSLEGLQLP